MTTTQHNGRYQWVIGTIIGILVSLAAFLGGRASVSPALEAHSRDIAVNTQRIATLEACVQEIKVMHKEQADKIDRIYTFIVAGSTSTRTHNSQ